MDPDEYPTLHVSDEDESDNNENEEINSTINSSDNNNNKTQSLESHDKNTESDSENKTFSDIGLPSWIVSTLTEHEIKIPTPVQENCIPQILKGQDVIGSAQTGTGKTAAFALPILTALSKEMYGVYAVVVSPTRELAKQIVEQFDTFGKKIGCRTKLVVGGLGKLDQSLDLEKRPHVVVGTPGRIAEHLELQSRIFKRAKYIVFDEADQLIRPSFMKPLKRIVSATPKRAQSLLFSATMSANLQTIKELLKPKKEPFVYDACPIYTPVDSLEQRYIFMPETVKDCYLLRLLVAEEGKATIVFTGSCLACQTLKLMLKDLGLKCKAIHSLIPQKKRLRTLEKFRMRKFDVLIATDVASRGLDIPFVEVVVNYDIPSYAKNYLHRVGRTARAGKGGLAVSLITQFDIELLHNIENHTRKQLSEYPIKEKQALQYMDEIAASRAKSITQLAIEGFEEKYKQLVQKRQRQKERHRAKKDRIAKKNKRKKSTKSTQENEDDSEPKAKKARIESST